jgi:hypothetical protein
LIAQIHAHRFSRISYGVGRKPAYDTRNGSTKETPSMYKKILVPVDGSETCQLGLQHAILLPKDQKAMLRL